MEFYTIYRKKDERFHVFIARMDSARSDLKSMFDQPNSNADYHAVLQASLLPEMLPTYFATVADKKSLTEMKAT